MTPQVNKLVKEALGIWRTLKRKHGGLWRDFYRKELEKEGWYVSHPGSDKRIARKGMVIVKWCGNCGWSDNAIRDELEIHKVLTEMGFVENLPKIYASRHKELIIEQYVNGECSSESMDELRTDLHRRGIYITDFREANVKAFMGIPKIIDGRLGEYDGEDGCSCYYDDEEPDCDEECL